MRAYRTCRTLREWRKMKKPPRIRRSSGHFLKTQVPGYDVEILVRDKGKTQYLYEVKFIENKKSSQHMYAEKTAPSAAQAVVENSDIVAQEKANVNLSDKKSSTKRSITLEEAEALHKESTEALLAEENAKAEKQAEAKRT